LLLQVIHSCLRNVDTSMVAAVNLATGTGPRAASSGLSGVGIGAGPGLDHWQRRLTAQPIGAINSTFSAQEVPRYEK
jgi:hypothetical protein